MTDDHSVPYQLLKENIIDLELLRSEPSLFPVSLDMISTVWKDRLPKAFEHLVLPEVFCSKGSY